MSQRVWHCSNMKKCTAKADCKCILWPVAHLKADKSYQRSNQDKMITFPYVYGSVAAH